MKKYICLFVLLLTTTLAASTIPQYQISSIDGNLIIFSNNAVLEVLFKDFITVRNWNAGDFVKLVGSDEGLFFFSSREITDGHLVTKSGFILRNENKENERAAVWLRQSPSNPSPGTFIITNIDLDDRTIVLNNLTSWIYPKEEHSKVESSQVGDIVMIGVNSSFTHSSKFDAMLINADRQLIIEAVEQ